MENQKIHANTLGEMISQAIKSYVATEGKSLRQIEYHSGVSFSYIRRLANQEIEEHKIDCIKLYQVLKLVKNAEFAMNAISRNDVWLKKVTLWTGLPASMINQSLESKDIEKMILESDELIVAFILGLNNNGVSLEELKEVGGMPLLKAANFLMEEGVLVKDNTRIKYLHFSKNGDKFFSFSRDSLKRVSIALMKYYDKRHCGQFRNYLSLIHEGFSVEFIQKAQEKLNELRSWLNVEFQKPENLGPNPTFIGLFMDTFTEELIYDKKGQQ